MTESQFIDKNREKWKELETLLSKSTKDPDKLHRLFVEVSSDLSYARTFFPNRSVRLYLNNLTKRIFDSMSAKDKPFGFKQVLYFFRHKLPLEVYRSRKALLVSCAIFLFAFLIGIISSVHNPDFPRIVLGDRYIEMTNQNISEDDPMAVYKDSDMAGMFFGITINNVRVAFLAFVLGLFGAMGTVVVLMYNGFMLAAFQYFFYSKGLFLTSFLTIWIHGTIEISAIMIAGGAGIILGNGLLFPNTYDRTTSIQIAAKRALTILLGTVPLFVLAGLLESFVTRETGFPVIVKALIIAMSLLLIVFMWIVVPWKVGKVLSLGEVPQDPEPHHFPGMLQDKHVKRSVGAIVMISFEQYRNILSPFVKKLLLPLMLFAAFIYWYRLQVVGLDFSNVFETGAHIHDLENGGYQIFVFYWLSLTLGFCFLSLFMRDGTIVSHRILPFIKQCFLKISIISAVCVLPFLFFSTVGGVVSILLIGPQFIVGSVEMVSDGQGSSSTWSEIVNRFKFSWNRYSKFILLLLLIFLILWIVEIMFNTGIVGLISNFINWHQLFEEPLMTAFWTNYLLRFLAYTMAMPIFYFLISNQIHSEECEVGAIDLRERFEKFGNQSSVFERV